MQTSLPDKTYDPWQATQAQTRVSTRLMGSDEYLGRNVHEVGTRVGEAAFELFAVCPPAEALQLQFEAHQPNFIAIHDVGTRKSARFVAELAVALRLPLQTLALRRQGFGDTLATLQFIELPSPGTAPLRLYSTACDGEPATQRLLAEVLLAFSRLAVLLVGPLPAASVAGALAPLRDRLLASPWNNRQLLVVPVAPPPPTLAEQARRLVEGTLVAASITPMAANTASRWGFVHGAWNRLRGHASDVRQAPEPAAVEYLATEPMPMRPMPVAGGGAGAIDSTRLAHYVQACSMLKGSLGCCVFELAGGRAVAHAGRRGNIDQLAAQGASLLGAALDSEARLGGGGGAAECVVTLEQQLILVRRMPQQATLGMLVAFDRPLVNPMLVQVQLQRLDPLLDPA